MAYKNIKTVGELKEFLANFSDDTPILHYHQDMEKSGYVDGVGISTELTTLYESKRMCYDAFDGTAYMFECYSRAESDGEKIQGLII